MMNIKLNARYLISMRDKNANDQLTGMVIVSFHKIRKRTCSCLASKYVIIIFFSET